MYPKNEPRILLRRAHAGTRTHTHTQLMPKLQLSSQKVKDHTAAISCDFFASNSP